METVNWYRELHHHQRQLYSSVIQRSAGGVVRIMSNMAWYLLRTIWRNVPVSPGKTGQCFLVIAKPLRGRDGGFNLLENLDIELPVLNSAEKEPLLGCIYYPHPLFSSSIFSFPSISSYFLSIFSSYLSLFYLFKTFTSDVSMPKSQHFVQNKPYL